MNTCAAQIKAGHRPQPGSVTEAYAQNATRITKQLSALLLDFHNPAEAIAHRAKKVAGGVGAMTGPIAHQHIGGEWLLLERSLKASPLSPGRRTLANHRHMTTTGPGG